jgi:hypothetical protein
MNSTWKSSWRVLLGVAVAWQMGAGAACAGDDGLVLRANGFVRGKADISDGAIKCEVPATGTAIADGAFSIGIWNTYGFETLFFPDTGNPEANPCGGWLQLQNNSLFEGLTLDVVRLKFRIQGAKRWRTLVPTRAGFPSACSAMRRTPLFAGARMDPYTGPPHSSSGAPNVAHVQLLPIVRSELIHCLRSQFDPLSTTTFVDLPLVIEAKAYATSDSGSRYQSNTVRYTLNMRHTCGNGRVDDGEQCDPDNPLTDGCNGGICKDGECSLAKGVPCVDNIDCVGRCVTRGNPVECTCVF